MLVIRNTVVNKEIIIILVTLKGADKMQPELFFLFYNCDFNSFESSKSSLKARLSFKKHFL